MWERFHFTGQSAMANGRWADAERDFKMALKEAETGGPNDPRLPMTLVALANCFRQQGRWAESEPLYKRALTTKMRQVGPVSLDLIPVMENYAKMLRAANRAAEADKLEYRAKVIFASKK